MLLNEKIKRQTLIISDQNDLRNSFKEIASMRENGWVSEQINPVTESRYHLTNTEMIIRDGLERMFLNMEMQSRVVEELEERLKSNQERYTRHL